MPKKKARTEWIKIRVTPEEKRQFVGFAELKKSTVATVLRNLFRRELGQTDLQELAKALPRRRQYTAVDPALIRELARIGNNLNQIAKWANTHQGALDAVEVCAALEAIDQQLDLISFSYRPQSERDEPA